MNPPESSNREKVVRVFNGWVMLPIVLGMLFGGLALFFYSIVWSDAPETSGLAFIFYGRGAHGSELHFDGRIFRPATE
jgi:hypothetical protein